MKTDIRLVRDEQLIIAVVVILGMFVLAMSYIAMTGIQ